MYNKEAEDSFIKVYQNDYKRQKEIYNLKLRDEIKAYALADLVDASRYQSFLGFEYKPKHLMLAQASYSGLGAAAFYLIEPKRTFNTLNSFFQSRWLTTEETENFRVIFDSGEIITFKGTNLGEGMASTGEIILSNGETPDFTRFDFEVWTEQGKILKAFIDTVIQRTDKVFDFKRKCWFIKTELVDSLLLGINTLINQGTLKYYVIIDNRETIESFEDFFTAQAKGQIAEGKKLSKEELYKQFEHILKEQAQVMVSLRTDSKVSDFKPYYRKAALALHPDRNNGDGTKMAQLNVIWSQLQEYL